MKRTFFTELDQGSSDWHEARAGIVTASAMRSLVTGSGQAANNDTSRGLIRTLAAERIMGKPADSFSSRMMDRGNLLEPHARDLYAEHYAPVEEVGFIRLDTERYAIGYSPDGLVGHDGLIEIKSPGPKEHLRTVLADIQPTVYDWQLQVGLFVTGRSWIDFVSYCPGMDLYVKRVYPNPEAFETINTAVTNAENQIRGMLHTYYSTGRANNRIHTEHFDPWEEEEITF